MSYLDRIREANHFELGGFIPFIIAGRIYGCVRHGFAEQLSQWPEIFQVSKQQVCLSRELADPGTTVPDRTRAVAQACMALRQAGVISGWRDELYPICDTWGAPPVLLLERAAVPFFGVTAYGVHLNGFVGSGDQRKMWIARRALSKPTGPGKLDQIVAGGQPHGITLQANMIKECHEEAAIPETLARAVQPVGTLSYILESAAGLRPDILFIFDLKLPEDFQPRNNDGEVETFYCMKMREVMAILRSGTEFKFNCALVQIDFLVRHGHICADHPDYSAICGGLRQFTPGSLGKILGVV